jgi:class 3 adenylate cyclase/predicted ATPase
MDDWLRSIGLEHRIGAFHAESVAHDQLAELTEDDLRALGLTIGERRRFRRALVELHDGRPTPPPLPSTLTERRPLTMMFVDLVESSAMGERLEPEDLLEVIRRYREFCGAIIRRYGGSVARQVGDGILAYFSYPLATENDPERAVRAALDLARDIEHLGVSDIQPPVGPLRVRIGIATGRVIISDMLAGGQADLRTIIGSAPNLAARLQGLARPGGVVIARETHERVRDLFACEHLGPSEMRGFAEPRPAWRVLHELPRAGWGPGLHPARLTPFCARRAELAMLGEHWASAARGAGGAVLVRGEAGIGKSRLIETFLTLHCREECGVLQLAASPFDVDSPLQPFAAWLRGQANGASGAEAADLAELLGIGPAEAAAWSPAQIREWILAALLDRVLTLAADQPLCLLVEDLHWLDPTSLELLERLVARLGGRKVLLLLSARDGFEAPWLAQPAVATLRLARLGADDVAAMVHGLFERADLPAHLVGQLVRKSDGVPLFVVELLRGLLQPGGQSAALRAEYGEEGEAEIPASLHESLMARLDRAGLAKEVAQVAAVIGRSVRPGTLAAVAGRVAAELEAPLAALVGAGVLHRDGGGPAVSYTFTHALVRDAAYDSLLRDQRQGLHWRVARVLREHDPKAVEQQPELLALHLAEAGRPQDAGPYWVEAARRSLSRSALTEATRLLRRGLAALEKAPVTPDQTDLRLRLMALLGPALIALKGPGSADAQDLYSGAYQLCHDLPEHPSHVPIYWGWWRMSREYAGKLDRAEALLGRARLRADGGLLLQAHHCCWASHYCVGNLAAARAHAEAGLAIYATGDFREHARLYGNHDARVCAHGELAETFWLQGRPLRALAQEREALAWAREIKHLGSTVHALDYQLIHRACRRDLADVYSQADELARFAAGHALADHHAKALIFRGWSKALHGDTTAGLALLEDGIARQRDIGTDEDFPIYLSLLAEVLIRAGKADRALDELAAARAQFAQIGLRIWVPELVRLHGEATLAADPGAEPAAAAHFAESARLAAEQGAVMLGLRTAASAARLHARRGAADAGARLLDAALAGVAEDDGGADMQAAAALLAEYRALGLATERVG